MHPQTDTIPSRPADTPRPVRREGGLLRRFRRDQDGSTAIEFAFVAIPFFALTAAILEIALMFWSAQVLEDAVSTASRPLLTGEAVSKYANAATAAANFKNDLCSHVPGLFDCQANVKVDVKSYASFATAQANKPVANGAIDTTGFGFSQVGAGQIAVIRAVLEYPVILTGWNKALADLGNGKRAMMATVTFRTEPYVN